MAVLLTIQGKCAGLRAKSAHISSHLPTMLLVNDLKVRPNQPEGSNFAFKVRSRQKPHGWSRFWSRGFDVRDENLCHLFSPEKCPVVMKRSRTLEMVSNLQRNTFDLKVRHRDSQSSIFVRTLRSFTINSLKGGPILH